MSSVLVMGAGYVGLVTAACLARLGHAVKVYETDAGRVEDLKQGRLPIEEPGIGELWEQGVAGGRLGVADDLASSLDGSDFVFLAVGTPSLPDGGPDLAQVQAAVESLAAVRPARRPIIVTKSTVPVGTADEVARWLSECGWYEPLVVSNPEFLREGRAVLDFLRPDRIVIGSDRPEAGERVAELYASLRRPFYMCSARTAEMIKYASNVFLCTKVSFINELASLCDALNVDVKDVGRALELDPRMGAGYFEAGLGWGGSCLPKDIQALRWTAGREGVATPILDAVWEVNELQPQRVIENLRRLLGGIAGRRVAVLGLTFKPNCDDLRESPALKLIERLQAESAEVVAFDPVATSLAAQLRHLQLAGDPYAACDGADAVVLTSAWRQFETLDFHYLRQRLARPLFIDARNALSPGRLREAGLFYLGIGRGRQDAPAAPVVAGGAREERP